MSEPVRRAKSTQLMHKMGTICIFFKNPVPGGVKTRLVPAVTPHEAAELARAFFVDTLAATRQIPWARTIIATTAPILHGISLLPHEEVVQQGEGDLGCRLERVLADALQTSPFAVALGADSPGLPAELMDHAHRALETSDSVLGPTEDGGYYLVGLKRCPRGLFLDLPWSCPTTFEATRSRFLDHRLTVGILAPWFDVDIPRDLERLRELLHKEPHRAPQSAALLKELEAKKKAPTGALTN